MKRQNVKSIQKNVKDVRFTNGYIWTLSKDNKVYQFPLIKKFNDKEEVVDT